MLGGDAAGVGRRPGAQLGALLTEDLAVGPAPGSAGRGRSARAAGRGRSAEPARRGATAAHVAVKTRAGCRGRGAKGTRRGATAGSVAAQAGPAGDGRSRGLWCHVPATQGGAVTAENRAAAVAADAQAGSARRVGPGLTADADARQRAGDVGSGGTVQRSTLTGDESRLTARPGRERRVPAAGGEATCVGRAGQPRAGRKTGLTARAAAGSEATASGEASTSAQPSLTTQPRSATQTSAATKPSRTTKPSLTAQRGLTTESSRTTEPGCTT